LRVVRRCVRLILSKRKQVYGDPKKNHYRKSYGASAGSAVPPTRADGHRPAFALEAGSAGRGRLAKVNQGASPRTDANRVSVPLAQVATSAELEDRIRQRAYEIYVPRGRQDERADEDWLLAEVEILGITQVEAIARLSLP
jgi:hypothetical protein